LKLPQLLSQFLYQTRKLDLPGIGSFVLEASAIIPEESDKLGQVTASGISFKNANILAPDDALIGFITKHTGKMKPLAAADLDFYLTTGKQLLNIGKPFYLEGIGTLLNNREGRLDFTPGQYMIARLEEPGSEKKERSEKRKTFDEKPREYEPRSNTIRQVMLFAGILIALIAIGWGGYHLYRRNTYVEPAEASKAVVQDTVVTQDTAAGKGPVSSQPATAASNTPANATGKPADSPAQPASAQPIATQPSTIPSPATGGAGTNLYKFVILRTDNKDHALRRYAQLLGYQLNIKMDQRDSSYFKLYFPISAKIRDTTHIKDSLIDVYAARVTIEH
jgi:hypothetical protein